MSSLDNQYYASRKWAVQIQKHAFFIDTWTWIAMPIIDGNKLGEWEFGGNNYKSYDEAEKAVRVDLMRKGLNEAVLLDVVKDVENDNPFESDLIED